MVGVFLQVAVGVVQTRVHVLLVDPALRVVCACGEVRSVMQCELGGGLLLVPGTSAHPGEKPFPPACLGSRTGAQRDGVHPSLVSSALTGCLARRVRERCLPSRAPSHFAWPGALVGPILSLVFP